MGDHIQFRSLAPFLFNHEELAAEFHLQDRLSVLDLYHIFVVITNYSRDHRELAIPKSFSHESGCFHPCGMITGKILGNTYVRNNKAADVSGFLPDMSADIFYEVLRLVDGQVLFLHDHLERLQASISRSGIVYPGDPEIMENLALLVRENPFQNGNIRISLQRSRGKETDLHCYFIPYVYPDPEMYVSGVSLHIYPHVRPNPGIKKWDDQFRKAVSAYLLQHEVYEVVLKNPQNQITEGSRSNIFFIDGKNRLITPPSRDVLKGITRKYLLKIASLEGLQIHEKRMFIGTLDRMDAVFISGTSPKVLPVKQIDAYSYGVDHPVLRMLMEKFEVLVRQNLTRL